MRTVSDRRRQNCAGDVKVKTASVAVVREAIALLPTRITGEKAQGVRGFGEKSENMLFMARVSDLSMHLETINMEGKTAGIAGIE